MKVNPAQFNSSIQSMNSWELLKQANQESGRPHNVARAGHFYVNNSPKSTMSSPLSSHDYKQALHTSARTFIGGCC